MAKKKYNIWYIIISLILIIFIIGAYKALKNHQEKEYKVVNNKILEAAKKCYLDKECVGKTLLKDLYAKDYLNTQIDPVSKENMNEDICIIYENNEVKFCE